MEGTVGSGRPARVPEAILREGTRASVGAGPEKCRLFQNKLEMEMTPPTPPSSQLSAATEGPRHLLPQLQSAHFLFATARDSTLKRSSCVAAGSGLLR